MAGDFGEALFDVLTGDEEGRACRDLSKAADNGTGLAAVARTLGELQDG